MSQNAMQPGNALRCGRDKIIRKDGVDGSVGMKIEASEALECTEEDVKAGQSKGVKSFNGGDEMGVESPCRHNQ